MGLKEYRKKRDFSITGEPQGNEKKVAQNIKAGKSLKEKAGKKRDRKLFVIQYHLARREHYDVRLEFDGVLISFAVPKGPSFNPKDKRLAVKVEDHPIEYASFEGVIPKGEYGGGIVMLWDKGEYIPLESFKNGLKKGILKFEVFGERIKGKWTLIRLKNSEYEDNWLLIKENDEFVKKTSGISGFTKSVKSGLTCKQIERKESKEIIKNPFNKVECKLAKLVESVPITNDYVSEIKFDGYRILAFIENGKVTLKTRNNIDFTKKFSSVCEKLEEFFCGKTLVLDGEMIVQDKTGRSDFGALQNLLKNGGTSNLVYMLFDLLALDGEDLRNLPLIERKSKLENLLLNSPQNLQFSEHIETNIKDMFNKACKLKLEGVILKKKNSQYNGKRDDDWLKIKCYNLQEFVIGGYVISSKKEHKIGALLLGVYDKNKLIYMGKAGTGINRENAKVLKKNFVKFKTNISPFENLKTSKENVVFLKPKMVANIQFAEITKDNNLRQASFKGLREDKEAKDVVLETTKSQSEKDNKENNEKSVNKEKKNKGVKEKANNIKRKIEKTSDKFKKENGEKVNDIQKGVVLSNKKKNKMTGIKQGVNRFIKREEDVKVCGIKITSPEKIVFVKEKINKLDVVKYYEKVADKMLKFVSNRLLSVVRCHDKLNCFYKKHPNVKSPYIKTLKVDGSEEKEEYFYINSKKGLILEAQLGTIEFHAWGSKVKNINYPDIMVFDLDPDEKLDLTVVRQGVKDLKKILDSLKLKAFLKTSGGKGYHILVPFKANKKVDYEKFRTFSENVAKLLEEKWGNKYTTNIRKENRKGKILIDYFRNTKGATSVAPYSLRARNGAKVSMPIFWKELDKIKPDEIDMKIALNRIKTADPWKNFFIVKQSIK